MYNNSKDSTSELWAVVFESGNVCFSRGGSSSKPKLMVYETKEKAQRALNNSWTKQILKNCDVEIKCIYKNI